MGKQFANIVIIFISGSIILLNFYIYFGQQSINPTYFAYNYKFGDAYGMDIIKYINEKNLDEVYVPKTFINDRSNFFLKKGTLSCGQWTKKILFKE